jgi:hypothetical protein
MVVMFVGVCSERVRGRNSNCSHRMGKKSRSQGFKFFITGFREY